MSVWSSLATSVKKWLFILLGVVLVGAGVAFLWPHAPDEGTEDSGDRAARPLPDFDPVRVSSETPTGLSLTGVVKDARGQPVPGAEVSLAASSQASLATVRCEECGQLLLSCPSHETFGRMRELFASGRGQLQAGAMTRTDADGKFRFDNLFGVSFTVWASAEGHGAAVHERAAPGDPVELFLPALRSIVGVVKGEDGAPLQGAKVRAVSRRLPIPSEAVTDAGGVFQLPGLGEGPFYVLAEAEGFLPFALQSVEAGPEPLRITLLRPRSLEVEVVRGGTRVDATVQVTGDHLSRTAPAKQGLAQLGGLWPDEVWLGASAEGLSALPQKVTLDERVTRVRLELVPGGRVLVTVVDDAGQPVTDPELLLSRTVEDEPFTKQKARTGELVAFGPLPEGQYLLTALATGYRPVQVPVKVTTGESQLDVVMARGTFIRGRVLDEYGRPAPRISVLVEPTGNAVLADDEGRFTADVPSPGFYVLQAHHSDWGGGETKVTAPAEGVELHLEPKAGLRVTVESGGRRLEGAEVNVWQDHEAVFRNDRPSGSDGVVLMRGVPAGKYSLIAVHRDFLPSARQQVLLREGELTEVTVSLDPGGSLSGQVVDEHGAPIAGAHVGAIPRGSDPAITGADGRFEIRPVRPGRSYRLEALHPSYDQKDRVIAEVGGEPAAIVLVKRNSFRGRVVDEHGTPITSFRVESQDIVSPDGRFELPLAAEEGRIFAVVEAAGFQPHMLDAPSDRFELGDIVLSSEPQAEGIVRDGNGAPVEGAVVSCDVCDAQMTTGPDGTFALFVPSNLASFVVTATRGSLSGTATAKGKGESIELVLRNAVHLTGRVYVEGGAPAPGVQIEAVHMDRAEPFTAVTMQDGTYSMDLPEGGYRFTLPNLQRPFAGDPVTFAYLSGQGMTLDLGPAPGTGSLTVHLQPQAAYALWIVRGSLASVGNPPMELFKSSWAQMVYQPRTSKVVLKGLPPGPYTVVWSRFHAQTSPGPVLRPVEVPGTGEITLSQE